MRSYQLSSSGIFSFTIEEFKLNRLMNTKEMNTIRYCASTVMMCLAILSKWVIVAKKLVLASRMLVWLYLTLVNVFSLA